MAEYTICIHSDKIKQDVYQNNFFNLELVLQLSSELFAKPIGGGKKAQLALDKRRKTCLLRPLFKFSCKQIVGLVF